MPESETFDLVVLGSGPGGEKGAAQAAYFGKKVALIESGNPGWDDLAADWFDTEQSITDPSLRSG